MAEGSGILDPLAPLSYVFGGGGVGMSLEDVKRRRAVQTALAAKARGFPKNIGEGLTSLGEALGERRMDAQLTDQERALQAAEDLRLGKIPQAPGISTTGSARTSDLGSRDRIAAYYAGGQGGAAPNPTLAAGDTSPQATSASGDPSDDPHAVAIGGLETGGQADPYRTVGVPTKYGPALGRYGVVAANVPKWTAAALGQPLTPQQYLADPAAQDAVFKHRFGQYVNQFGEEGAARAWFGGPGNVNNPGVTDAHGRLTVGTYGQDYLRRLQGAKRSGAIYPAGGMTGASLAADAAPVLAEENPATPTDIAAAPAPMLVASGASEGDDRGGSTTIDTATGADPAPPAARTMPGIRPPPATAHGVRVTGDTLPSSTAIPPPSEQTMPDPGPEPKPPPRIEFSPRQQMALEVMNSRNSSEHGKAFAKQQFDIEEKIRTELMQRRETDYAHQRQRWEKLTDEKNKFEREAEDRKIKQMADRVGVEKTILDLAKTYHERDGGAWDTALQKARLEVAQAQRNLSEPKTTTLQGTQFSQNYDPKTGTWGPLGVTPGAPSPEGKPLTEQQAEGVRFVLRTKADLDTIERDLNHGKVLTQWDEAARGNVPLISKFTRSEDYAKARNAFNNFEGAFLKLTSGTAITPTEAALQLPAFIPQANDSDAELREKSRRRREFFEAVKGTTGASGLEAIEKTIRVNASEHDESKKPPVPVSTPAEAAALPPGRKIIMPDGTTGVVPRRR